MSNTHESERAPLWRRIVTAPVFTQLAILVVGLGLWQRAVKAEYVSGFLFGWPTGIAETAWRMLLSGELLVDAGWTLWASAVGFVVGTVVGSAIGLGLWYSPWLARVIAPYIAAINSVPKIAFAPLVILWFGTGVSSKVALSISLTLVVALLAAFHAARTTDPDLQKMMASLGCSRSQIFTKVVVPSSMPDIIGAFQINIGFALVGTVVGEFISSRHGMGHVIFVASSMYDLNTVWVGIISLMIMGFLLSMAATFVERRLLAWKDATFAPTFTS